MSAGEQVLLACHIGLTCVSYSVLRRGAASAPWIAHVGLAIAAMMPLTWIAQIAYGIQQWFARHWRIVKIERSLRD